MLFLRRQLLRTLSFAFGSSFILTGKQLGLAAQTAVSPKLSPSPAGAAVRDGIAGGMEMEKVTGIGGFFFRAKDPKALGSWYQQHLGISLIPSSEGDPVWEQEAGPTALAPFPETSKYFGDCPKGLDAELSSPGSRQNGGTTTGRRNRDQDLPARSHRPVCPRA